MSLLSKNLESTSDSSTMSKVVPPSTPYHTRRSHLQAPKVRRVTKGNGGVLHIATHNGRTFRYPDPNIKANDTVIYDFDQGKITDFVKFDKKHCYGHWRTQHGQSLSTERSTLEVLILFMSRTPLTEHSLRGMVCVFSLCFSF